MNKPSKKQLDLRQEVFKLAKEDYKNWTCGRHPWIGNKSFPTKEVLLADLTPEEVEEEEEWYAPHPCTCGKEVELLYNSPSPEEFPDTYIDGNSGALIFNFGVRFPDQPHFSITTWGPDKEGHYVCWAD